MADKKTNDQTTGKPAAPANPVPEGQKSPTTTGAASPAPGQPVSGHPVAGHPSAVPGGGPPIDAQKIARDTGSIDPNGGKVSDTDTDERERLRAAERDAGNANRIPEFNTEYAGGKNAALPNAGRLGRAAVVSPEFDFFVEVRAFIAAGRELNGPGMMVHGGRLLTMGGEALGGAEGGVTVAPPSLRAFGDDEASRKANEMEQLATEFQSFKEEANGRAHHFARPDYYRHGPASGMSAPMAAPRNAGTLALDPGTIIAIIELVGKLIDTFRKK